ncbi:hypothetical protein R5R35_013912 [Gryllus longicercus]|uniref:Major facilitator superfamily (MFS) profile domain-containing protein n=1 Tax=Gryllus longicercus TaxID=2509291 RepID=A0AAN9ZB79_9ORTH
MAGAQENKRATRWLRWLRGGKSDLGADVTQVTESARRARSGKLVPVPLLVQRIARALTQQPSAYALWVVFLLMVFRQLTGLHAVVFYTVEIFEDAKSVVPAPYAAIIIGVVEVIATYLASVLVDRWGRRFLLLTSAVGTTACHASLAMYYAFLHHGYDLDDFSWLPLLFIALFIVNCACGFGPLPWFMMAELTPTEHKNWAAGMTGFLNWGSMFLVLKLFPTLTTYLGEYVAFAIFSLNCLLASFFVFFWVPETKGKTLEEIQNEIAESRGH